MHNPQLLFIYAYLTPGAYYKNYGNGFYLLTILDITKTLDRKSSIIFTTTRLPKIIEAFKRSSQH